MHFFKVEPEDDEELRKHREWHQVKGFVNAKCVAQVELDVQRTLARFPPNISDERRSTLQDQLTPLIIRVLKSNERFHYYQGFHDVCLTILLVCGYESALEVCKNLARHGPFRSYLLKSLEQSVLRELDLLYVILSRVDPQLETIMRDVHLGTMFALSWPLTWFSHALEQYQQVCIVHYCTVFRRILSFTAIDPNLCMCSCSFEEKICHNHQRTVIFTIMSSLSIIRPYREMPIIHQLLSTMPYELHSDAILSDSLYLASLMPPFALKTEFTRIYKEQVSYFVIIIYSLYGCTFRLKTAILSIDGVRFRDMQ
ncbi:unnamed protein product [Cylicostephanus goldi]|uniref:Rab-GAP TBC domain-containing protein n=1 Tax=Cylicostephanus goldi TaxID=71465 RepID=A0A3P6QLX6_CYLGO|nr:unnamed protein product [Cylicostephanus goldi]